MNGKTIKSILIFFLAIAVVMIAVSTVAVRNIGRSVDSNDWVNHTHAVILETEALRSSLLVANGTLHTYVLTGDPRDQTACRNALADIDDHFQILSALTRLAPTDHAKVGQLELPINRYSRSIEELLVAKAAGQDNTVRTLLEASTINNAVREMERVIKSLKDNQLALLTERDTASYHQSQTTRWTVWTGVALNVLLLAGVAWLIRDDLSARRQVTTALEEANRFLESRVKERTRELGSANRHLSTENLERRWANHSLEHQLRYNQRIIDSISDLVFVTTHSLNISRVNPAVLHVTGADSTSLISKPLKEVVRLVVAPAGSLSPLPDPLKYALKAGQDLRDQPAEIQDRLGQRIPVVLSLFPLRDNNRVVGGIITLRVTRPASKHSA